MAPLGSPAAPHKGFGLALVIDALAGVLTGAAFARDFPSEPATAGNTFFWALDVEAFLPREEFLARMEAQIEQVKAGERLAGVDELLVPGERGHRRYQRINHPRHGPALGGDLGSAHEGLRIPVYRTAARACGRAQALRQRVELASQEPAVAAERYRLEAYCLFISYSLR